MHFDSTHPLCNRQGAKKAVRGSQSLHLAAVIVSSHHTSVAISGGLEE